MPLNKLRTASRVRNSVPLGPDLDKKLVAYTLCATAAGIVTLSPPVEAKVVFTPVNINILGAVSIDINVDGINDFTFMNGFIRTRTRGTQYLDVLGDNIVSNGVIGYSGSYYIQASALPAKVGVGSYRRFLFRGAGLASCTVLGKFKAGKWLGAKDKFLGLRFVIKGQTHYGWARLSFKNASPPCGISAILTGYAYETTANKPIVTGQRSGSSNEARAVEPENPASEPTYPASLGALAHGAAALDVRRKEEEQALGKGHPPE